MAKTRKRGAPTNISLDASRQKKFNQTVHRIQQNVKKGAPEAGKSGVVYVSHLPWGFEEKPLREYFKQFGKIKQLRVSRSKKTGNSRGYAYIQFTHDDVARIVAETMNNYLMFGKLIKCKHLLKPHTETFKNANRRFIQPGSVTGAIARHNSEKSDTAVEKNQRKMLSKLTKLEAKLAAKGTQYKLEDSHLKEVRKELVMKAEVMKMKRIENNKKTLEKKKKKMGKKQASKAQSEDNKDDDDEEKEEEEEEEDDDDDDDDDDEAETLKITPEKAAYSGSTTLNTSTRRSFIPNEVDTPKGKMNVLIEDSSEDEISFRTPPQAIKSSKLDDTLKSMKGTPSITVKKNSLKRRLNENTPVSVETPKPKVSEKKGKLTPNAVQKKNTPKVGLAKTPLSNKKHTDVPRSGKKTPIKKTVPSETKKKQLKK